TEGTLMAQTDVLCNRMVEIKKTGIRFSLDDFGIGYSSLSYLTRFPIDTLKIDISFVRGMMDDPKDLAVVDTIIDLADNLQLRTVAEGVEKGEQVTLLRLLGCQSMQGYFFSKPLPPAEFADLLRTDKRLPSTDTAPHPSVLQPAAVAAL
ncbi:MAG: EAL domain-containing protein, partial [Phycisphaerae bacterium]|nr:EAL domain-containing protein [Phycisphaerae bacterium]